MRNSMRRLLNWSVSPRRSTKPLQTSPVTTPTNSEINVSPLKLWSPGSKKRQLARLRPFSSASPS